MSASDQTTSREHRAAPLIQIRGLKRTYAMGQYEVQALRAVDISIEEGEFVAIMGPSGSGKSTLMYLLGCLDTPSSGSYHLRGEEVSKLDDTGLSRLRNREIGFVFQQFCLLPELDVTENIALGLTYAGQSRHHRRTAAREQATQIGLGDRLNHRPSELSGGQMQRVAIARALAGRPHIILADEPTGNLDSKTGREILELFGKLNAAGHTVLLVTHDANVAAQAHRVITLDDGRIVGDKRQAHEQVTDEAAAGAPAPQDTSLTGLRLQDLLSMSLYEGLLAHKLRSILTMLGIVFGIAAVISMTAITEGGKQQQLEHLSQIGMNNIQVRDLDLEAARLLRERRINPRGVTLQDMDHVCKYVDGIYASTAWKEILAEIRFENQVIEDANTIGVCGDFQSVANFYVVRGRFLDEMDEEAYRRVCVVGPEIIDDLAMGDEPIGKYVIIGDQPFTVVGVMERKAFTTSEITDIQVANRNRDVYVPYQTFRRYFRKDSKDSELDVISLRMDSDERLLKRSELIKFIVGELHMGATDFAVSVPLEKLKQAQQTKHVFNIIIIVIAGISLVVGGIGIMNIMLATVTERTSEIGIRRAIGASRRDVMRQFLTESMLISIFGGLLGLIVGVLGGLLIQQIFGFVVAFSATIMVLATAVCVAIGIGFGLYPAWLAATMDPVDALRN